MADFEQKPNTGSLFKNKNKSKPTDKDYSGKINVNGQLFWLNAWVNESKTTGEKYFGLTVNPVEARPSTMTEAINSIPKPPVKEDILPF